MANQDELRRGTWYAVSAFFIWGIIPLYFKQIEQVPAAEILSHRIIWSVAFIFIFLMLTGRLHAIRAVLSKKRNIGCLLLTTILISINWGVFTWAATHGRVLETSLGYFINPLINVLLGMIILGERLRPMTFFAVLLATIGVLILLINHGSLPWVSLSLAVSFGFYGLIRKIIQVDALPGLLIETLFACPIALFYVYYLASNDQAFFLAQHWSVDGWLIFGGITTTVPLALFAAGANVIKLSTLGFIQYIAPSLTFLIAIFLFKETFDIAKFITFCFIWLALFVLTYDNLKLSRSAKLSELS